MNEVDKLIKQARDEAKKNRREYHKEIGRVVKNLLNLKLHIKFSVDTALLKTVIKVERPKLLCRDTGESIAKTAMKCKYFKHQTNRYINEFHYEWKEI